MKIKLKNSTYTGVAGSSLSETRCEQTVDLYNFIISHPGLSYREVRSESVKEGLYKSESVLRTFCPLLRELGFINTDQGAPMSFTKDGEMFVEINFYEDDDNMGTIYLRGDSITEYLSHNPSKEDSAL